MIVKLVSIFAIAQLAVAQDFPISFKDGMIGVNFGGYHAEAGLGGLLTGNAANGGLIASAGTPSGQSAVAGLGGNTGPNQRGGLFAGATAGSGVGASASLAGDVNNGGSFGVGQADAYAGGVRKEVIKTVGSPAYAPVPAPSYAPVPAPVPASAGVSTDTRIDSDDDDLSDNIVPQTVQQRPAGVNVQKIKVRPQPQYTTVYQNQAVPAYPSTYFTKTYSYQPQVFETAPIHQYPIPVYQPVVYQKRIQFTAPQIVQRVETVEQVETTPSTTTTSTTPRPPYVYTYDKQKVINEIFSIPFHALRAVSDIINAKLGGGYAVQKTISYA